MGSEMAKSLESSGFASTATSSASAPRKPASAPSAKSNGTTGADKEAGNHAGLNGARPPVQPPPAAAPRAFAPILPGTAQLMAGLFERAADKLTPTDLDALEDRAEDAAALVRQLQALCVGLGCLVANDGGENDAGTGSFKSASDLSGLLFLLAGVADHAGALLDVAALADNQRLVRQLQRGAA